MIAALFPEGVVAAAATEEMWTGSLHPYEEACIGQAREKRRREFTAGRVCARRALAQLGIRDFPLLVGPDRAPLWPRGIVGSISHCEGYCAVVVARQDRFAGLGLDVERGEPLGRNLVKRVCRPAEIARLDELAPLEGIDWAKLTFSAKESVYKCHYQLAGVALGFQDIEVVFAPRDGTFTARLMKEAAPGTGGIGEFDGRFACDGVRVSTGVSVPTRSRSS